MRSRPPFGTAAVVVAVVAADGIWGAEGAFPPTGGAILAAGAVVLACAAALRRSMDAPTAR